jgi:hypothetical protein
MSGKIAPDWGYEGYVYCTEDIALAGLPRRTNNWGAHNLWEGPGHNDAVGWDEQWGYLLNCRGLSKDEKPTNLVPNTFVVRQSRYPLWIVDFATGRSRPLDWHNVKPGSDEAMVVTAMVRGYPDPLFLEHYDRNADFQLKFVNSASGHAFTAMKRRP